MGPTPSLHQAAIDYLERYSVNKTLKTVDKCNALKADIIKRPESYYRISTGESKTESGVGDRLLWDRSSGRILGCRVTLSVADDRLSLRAL